MNKLFIQNRAALNGHALIDHAINAPEDKVSSMVAYQDAIIDERTTYEAQRERVIDGLLQVGQSPDIKQLEALRGSVALARLNLALGANPRTYMFPQSLPSGKTSGDTSNLKGLKKVREIAETVLLGHGGANVGLENVVKVLIVCMDKTVSMRGTDVIERKYAECYLNSSEYRSIAKVDKELFDSVEAFRAKQMTGGGAKTQVSQTVRMLSAFGAVEDVQNGRSKDIRFNREHPLIDALMVRLGFRTVTTEDASETVTEDTPEVVGTVDVEAVLTALYGAPVVVEGAEVDAMEVLTLEALDAMQDEANAAKEAATPKRKRNRK